MTDEFTFDWVALAPIEEVAAQVEAACVGRGLSGLWYSSARGGVPVKGCRITLEGGATLAALTLQGYGPGRTHLRLQPAARAAEHSAEVAALAEALRAMLPIENEERRNGGGNGRGGEGERGDEN
jgi:hypothetical protein